MWCWKGIKHLQHLVPLRTVWTSTCPVEVEAVLLFSTAPPRRFCPLSRSLHGLCNSQSISRYVFVNLHRGKLYTDMCKIQIYTYFHIKITANMKSEKQCAIMTEGIVTNSDPGKRYEMELLYPLHYFSYLYENI